MSKIHVLENNGSGQYKVVIHFPVSVGKNKAGKVWKTCLLQTRRKDEAGNPVITVLQKKTTLIALKPGQIKGAERTAIENGDVIEFVDKILVESGGATPESLNKMADKLIETKKAELQQKYRYYGYIQE